MGGLGKTMPFVRTAFVVGFLGLAAIPIVNGFWSKELVLEGGLHQGPGWAYTAMVLAGGLTALYGARLVWLTFSGKPRGETGHDAKPAMRIALAALAAGTLVSWLAAGPMSELLAETLPWHGIEAESTLAVFIEVVSAPATWLALAAAFSGLAIWRWRTGLPRIEAALEPLGRLGRAGLGFEWLNRQIVALAVGAAQGLRRTQTGHLGWNVVGVLAGLTLVVVLLGLWG
jgi:NADH-quinone oxidoreductase subunit L